MKTRKLLSLLLSLTMTLSLLPFSVFAEEYDGTLSIDDVTVNASESQVVVPIRLTGCKGFFVLNFDVELSERTKDALTLEDVNWKGPVPELVEQIGDDTPYSWTGGDPQYNLKAGTNFNFTSGEEMTAPEYAGYRVMELIFSINEGAYNGEYDIGVTLKEFATQDKTGATVNLNGKTVDGSVTIEGGNVLAPTKVSLVEGTETLLDKSADWSCSIKVDGEKENKKTFAVSAYDQKDNPFEVTWTKGDETDAGLTVTGSTIEIAGDAVGEHTVVASYQEGTETKTKTLTITASLTSSEATSVTVAPKKAEIELPGLTEDPQTATFAATVLDQRGNGMSGETVTWALDKTYTGVSLAMDDTTGNAVVTVDKTAAETGTAPITLTATHSEGLSGTAQITIKKNTEKTATSIEIVGDDAVNIDLAKNVTKDYSATAKDKYGDEVELPTGLVWVFEDVGSTGATFDAAAGQLTVPSNAKPGKVKLTLKAGETVWDKLEVSVKDQYFDGVLTVGNATADLSDGTAKQAVVEVKMTDSDGNPASFNSLKMSIVIPEEAKDVLKLTQIQYGTVVGGKTYPWTAGASPTCSVDTGTVVYGSSDPIKTKASNFWLVKPVYEVSADAYNGTYDVTLNITEFKTQNDEHQTINMSYKVVPGSITVTGGKEPTLTQVSLADPDSETGLPRGTTWAYGVTVDGETAKTYTMTTYAEEAASSMELASTWSTTDAALTISGSKITVSEDATAGAHTATASYKKSDGTVVTKDFTFNVTRQTPVIQRVDILSGTAVMGATDNIGIPGSKSYTAKAYDQYGDATDVTLVLSTTSAGISYADGTLTVTSAANNNDTATLTATAGPDTAPVTATLTITALSVTPPTFPQQDKTEITYGANKMSVFGDKWVPTGAAKDYTGKELPGTFAIDKADELLDASADTQTITVTFTTNDKTVSLSENYDVKVVPKALTVEWQKDYAPTYTGTAVTAPTVTLTGYENNESGLTATLKYVDSKGDVLTAAPVNAGSYAASIAALTAGEAATAKASNYTATGSLNFTVKAAENRWVTNPTIAGWTYGETASEVNPDAAALSGDAISYTYAKKNAETGEYGTPSATKPSDAGEYKLIATVAASNNYEALQAEVPFTIAQATNGWTTEPSIEGWTYGETAKEVSAGTAKFGTVVYSYAKKDAETGAYGDPTATKPSDAGDYKLIATVVGTDNYTELKKEVLFTIAKASVTVTANDKEITFGMAGANNGVTYNPAGVTLSGTPAYEYKDSSGAAYTAGSDVGEYAIVPSGLTSDNYEITYVNGKLTVGKKTVLGAVPSEQSLKAKASATADPELYSFTLADTVKYAENQAGTVTYTILERSARLTAERAWIEQVDGKDTLKLSIPASATPNSTDSDNKDSIKFKLSSTNYTDAEVTLKFEFVDRTKVSADTLGFSIAPYTYDGTAGYTLAPSYSGTKDDTSKWTYSYAGTTAAGTTYGPTSTQPTDAGSYTVTATYTDDIKDGIYFGHTGDVEATLTINKATLTVDGVASVPAKTYDKTTTVGTGYSVLLTGVLGNDEVAAAADAAWTSANAGTNTIKLTNIALSGAQKDNYTVAATADSVNAYSSADKTTAQSIAKASVTVTANDKEITFGMDGDNAGVTYDGLLTGDSLSGTPAYAYNTNADGKGAAYAKGNDVGEYYIVPSGLTSDNYEITFVAGKLTVVKKTVTAAETVTQTLKAADTASADPELYSFTLADTVKYAENQAGTVTYTILERSTRLNDDARARIEKVDGKDVLKLSIPKSVTPKSTDSDNKDSVKFKLSSTNYTDAEVTLNFEYLDKKPVTVTLSIAPYTYDGTAGYTVAGAYSGTQDSTSTWAYSYSGTTVAGTTYGPTETKPIDAGSYTVTATYTDNIVTTDAPYGHMGTTTATLEIKPLTATLEWSGTTKRDYDGSPSEVTATVANLVTRDGVKDTCDVTVTGGTEENAGTHTATATDLSNKNYALPTDSTKAYTIEQAQNAWTVTPAIAGWTYDGKDAMSTESGKLTEGKASFGSVSYTWEKKNGSAYEEAKSVKDAGEYRLTATVKETTNYKGKTEVIDFTVSPLTATLKWSGATARDYNGNASNVTATVTNLVSVGDGKDTCTVTVENGDKKDAGTYTATATGLSNANYVLPTPATQSYTINKKVLTIKSVAIDNKEYDGTTNGEGSLELDGMVGSDKVSATGTFMWSSPDAGTSTFQVTDVKLEETSNYRLAETSKTGTSETTTITQKTVALADSNPPVQSLKSKATASDEGESYSIALGSLIAYAAQTGMNPGTVTYAIKTSGTTLTGERATIESGALKITLAKDVTPESSTAEWDDTIILTVSSTNYADQNVTLKFKFQDKKDVSKDITFADVTRDYDASNNYAMTARYSGSGTWTYLYAGTDGTTYGPTADKPVNAGTYTVTATYEDSVEEGGMPGHLGTATATLTINKITAALAWSGVAARNYDGTASNVTATVSNQKGSDKITVTVENGDKKDAGTYTATATALSDTVNYVLPEAKTQSYTISKKDVKITGVKAKWEDGKVELYGGTIEGMAKGTVVTINLPAPFDWTGSVGTAQPVTYTPTLDGADKDNYNLVSFNDVTVDVPLPETEVVKAEITKTEPAASVDLSEQAVKDAVDKLENTSLDNKQENGVAEAASNVAADSSKITPEVIADATTAVQTIPAAAYDPYTNPTVIVVKPILKVTANAVETEDDDNGKTVVSKIIVDVSASYQLIATTESVAKAAAGDPSKLNTTNSMVLEEKSLAVNDALTLTIPVPFADDVTVYITHTHIDNGTAKRAQYTAEADGGFVTFTSKNGLSGFELSTTPSSPYLIDDTPYDTLQAAVNAVQSGQTITLVKNADDSATVSKAVSFTLDTNGKTFTGSIAAGSGYKLTQEGDVYTVTSAGGSSGGSGGGSTVTTPVKPVEKTTKFVDVPANEYYADAVAWAVENGITTGTSETTFSPNRACTRAEAVTFLYRAAGSPKVKISATFKDVPVSSYYAAAVSWAVENGITNGTKDGKTFEPDAICSRAQIVTFLARFEKAAPGVSTFKDVPANEYYYGSVGWAVENGITNGTSATTFAPNAVCDRAQIVTFLYRDFMKK